MRFSIFTENNLSAKQVNRLILITISCIVIIFLIIVVRICFLSISNTKNNNAKINVVKQYNKKKNNQVKSRPTIVDRNNQVLAIDLKSYSLYVKPYDIVLSDKEFITELTDIVPSLSEKKVKRKIKNRKRKNHFLLKKYVSPLQQKEILEKGISGLIFKQNLVRAYPQGRTTSHALGIVNSDNKGIYGFERYLETNQKLFEQDRIYLTLDINIQSVVKETLLKHQQKWSAKAAAAILLEVDTGHIISMVSLPDFNPHSIKDRQNLLIDKTLNNKVTYETFEMGSVFKIFSITQALNLNRVNYYDVIPIEKSYDVGKYSITDYHWYGNRLSVPQIFYKSSNVGTIKIVNRLSIQEYKDFLHKLKILSPLQVEIAEKSNPKYPKKMRQIHLITTSYGYGISVTLLHVAQAIANIISENQNINATLLLNNQHNIKHNTDVDEKNKKINNLISTQARTELKKLLRLTVLKGTGRNANAKGYYIGGKTSTINKLVQGEYSKDVGISMFSAVFPIYQPKYVLLTIFDEPKKIGNLKPTGGSVAAPSVREIIMKIAPMLALTTVDEKKIDKKLLYK